MELNELLRQTVEERGSDLHVKVGSPPYIRIDGHLVLTEFPKVDPALAERIAFEILPDDRAEEFRHTNEADFALSVSGVGRFRVNVFRQRGSIAMVFRRVLPGIPSFESLGLPPPVRRLADEPRGLVLVTGPTGSGKTTTLAAMVDYINETKAKHIVTIEDPVEVLHVDKRSIVSQREVGTDTDSYAAAMKRVLRQDPDVIMIGEMRDAETVSAALSAAETGHLVLSSLHTTSAAETVNRIVDFFPPAHTRQVRLSLANSLRGVVSQRLMERPDGYGRVPAVEILINSAEAFDLLVDPDRPASALEAVMAGAEEGMQTFDQSLFVLYQNGLVGLRDAVATASHPEELRSSLARAGLIPG